MGTEKLNVLLVDDEPHIIKTMEICLEEMGLEVHSFLNPEEALTSIHQHRYDLAFVDLKMVPIDGIQLLEALRQHSPYTTVTIITAHGSIESAVQAVKKGAYDYLQKPFEYLQLQLFTEKMVEYHRLKEEVQRLRARVEPETEAPAIITRNSKMLEMIDLATRVAETDLNVLIEGESGTGKELFAQLIYEKSARVDHPFVKVNCAAIPEQLLESELFGHVKGAFTGAFKDRKGRFELADGGTIFLDEIGELAPALQAKLLRVLQQHEFERVGESKPRKIDVRFIAATNRNLEEAIEEGVFRKDLFYRLNEVRLRLLPLRDRPEDIPLLIRHFIDKYSPDSPVELSPDALKALKLYPWHGNVRELENVMQRAILLAKNHRIEPEELPEEIREGDSSPPLLTLEEMERQHIRKILQVAKDFKDAARILGIDPATLWRKRKRYGL